MAVAFSITPATVNLGFAGTQSATVTSASFNAPAGSIIVQLVEATQSFNVAWSAPSFSDSVGLTWNTAVGNATVGGTTAAAWIAWAHCPSAQTGMTVSATATVSDSGQYVFGITATRVVLTGADTTTPIASTQSVTPSATTATVTFSTPPAGSALLFSSVRTDTGSTASTASSGAYLAANQTGNGRREAGWYGTSTALSAPSTPQSITLTSGVSQSWKLIAVNVQAPAAGNTTVNLGAGSETDTASAVTKAKTATLGSGGEADSANTMVASKVLSLAAGAETGTANALSVVTSGPVTIALGSLAQSDVAGALTVLNPRTYTLGSAAESDAADALTVLNPRTYVLGVTSEAQTLYGLVSAKGVPVGVATQTSTALAITAPRIIGDAAETMTAHAITAQVPVVLTLGAPHDLAVAYGITGSVAGLRHLFSPPTFTRRFRLADPFFTRVPLDVGLTVLVSGPTVRALKEPEPELLTAADAVFLGGYLYEISGETRALLVNAGYGEYIESESR